MAVDAPPAALTACPQCGRRNRVPVIARGRPRCGNCHTDLPWLVDVADDTFAEAVLRSPLPVLVDVWAPWCGPCRVVAPVVSQLAAERAGRLKVAKVNADEAPATAQELRAQSIPTLLLFRDGTEQGRLVGAQPHAQLSQWIDRTLTGRPSSRAGAPT